MNRKQRRAALKNLNKKAYVSSPTRISLDDILNDKFLSSIEDPNQYAQTVKELLINQAKNDLLQYTNNIRQQVEAAAFKTLSEIDALEKVQSSTSIQSFEEAAADDK